MRIPLILLSAVLVLASCSKKSEDVKGTEDYDVKNRIFRVITTGTNVYSLSLVELHPNSSTPNGDTVRNIKSSSSTTLDVAFTPQIGNHVIVNAVSDNGTALNCTVVFKGQRLGIDAVQKVNGKLTAHYEYDVKD